MAILYSLTAIVIVLLALVGLVLHVDARGDRKARRAWERAADARIGGHDKAIATLERAIGLLVPADARPTAPDAARARAFDARERHALASRPSPIGLSRPYHPTPDEKAIARAAHTAATLERALLPEPPVDTEGDRGGINPGDAIPAESRPAPPGVAAALGASGPIVGVAFLPADEHAARGEQHGPPSSTTRDSMGAMGRALASVDAGLSVPPATVQRWEARRRELASDAPPPDEDSADEETRVYQPAQAPRRPTLLGGLAPRPARRDTLVSRGVMPPPKVAPTLPPASPGPPSDDPVDARYEALRRVARAAGAPCDHCGGVDCAERADPRTYRPEAGAASWGACWCTCDACDGARDLLAQADREVHGVPGLTPPPGGWANDDAPPESGPPLESGPRR